MTRMWMIEPECLCRKHLLGEHNEIHKAMGGIAKKKSIKGYVTDTVCLEPLSFESRHDELVKEFEKRSYNHKSPIKEVDLSYLPKSHIKAKVNPSKSLQELIHRCPDCKKRIESFLIKKYRGMVYKICNSWLKNELLEFDDMVSMANQTLLDCVEKYDSDISCFSTYTYHAIKNKLFTEHEKRKELLSKIEFVEDFEFPYYGINDVESRVLFKISIEKLSSGSLHIINSVLNTPLSMIDLAKEETGRANICKRRIQRHLVENEGWAIGRCWRKFDEIKQALA